MNLIDRTKCVISGKHDIEPLYSFPKFPVFMGCMDQVEQDDLKIDMTWWISRGSGLIQLKQLLPLEILYPESHGAGAIGALWRKHHQAFAQFLSKINPTAVLEIGGAHGILAKEYQNFSSIPWTILEPNPSPVDGCKAHFIKGFFDDKFTFKGNLDTLVHSHLFEHIYDPDEFVHHLSKFMLTGTNLVFSIPNMQVMLDRKYTNCINFEHTIFLTEPYIEYLLAKYGFRLKLKEYFMDDHSIFYKAERDPTTEPKDLPSDLYDKNKSLYLNYIHYHESLITELNEKIEASESLVYLFGAHVFAQYLIAFGLNTEKICCILDNDPAKKGKRLYGTSLMVQSPKALREVSNPIVILKAGVYNTEIKKDILENINSKVRFLE
jgi:hypothetical protein